MEPKLILNPETQLVTVDDPSPTVSVLWDRAAQQTVINTAVGPTIASRVYALVHTAMFDAWAAYDETAIATQLGDSLQRPTAENTEANKIEAMSFAAYRVLAELFPEERAAVALMVELGFNPDNTTTDVTTAAGIGNASAEALMSFRREDAANQKNGYIDTTGYIPVNTSDNIVDIERWTAERVPIDSPDAQIQDFLTPQWSVLAGFSLDSPDQFRPPAPQPFLLVDDATVDLEAQTIALADGTVLDISPELVGTIINPDFIAQAETVVDFSANLTDEEKLIAEFWEDAGGTSFPPGTWMTFGQFVSARDDNPLDEDAKLFFTLGNAVFDAGIATWEAKVTYDYVRPVRAIRSLGELGLIGEFNEDLGGFAIAAWAGPEQGTQPILAKDFTTYQLPGGDPSPPFSEYTSGHSGFSAAGATVLELLSGSDAFEAGVTFETGDSRFEPGFTPQADVTLAWETFSEAADEAGISRLYGGIHFVEGDINARILGQEVGAAVFETAQSFIKGQSQPFLIGTRDADELVGREWDEQLYGRGGDDVLSGGLGDDGLWGGDGDDWLRGDLNSADSQGNTGGDDSIFGGAGSDRIGGKGGNDRLVGDDGDDQIWGDAGDDWLDGGAGDDWLLGGRGHDILQGGFGRDFLLGGLGNDLYDYSDSSESPVGAAKDRILDFTQGEDKLDISKIDANLHTPGIQPFEFIGTDDFNAGNNGQVRYFSTGSRDRHTTVQLDIKGDGLNAVLEILLINVPFITASDFVLGSVYA
ncbi:MAG: DUF6851 domain-containing protein [Cyanobacteria bacterium P01_H01_bin.153]